jgi:3-dehydroquinate synthase
MMNEVIIKTDFSTSRVVIGEKLRNLGQYLPDKKTVIVTDENILRHYQGQLPDFPIVSIGLGEKNKTMDTLGHIFEKFLGFEVDRSWFVLAIGGGIVCDVAGFAASIYMRGLPFGFVSTTLLSQVDASVGGKNGVNFEGYKNMIGVFNQPDFVICDMEMLHTLEKREYLAGFAEIIKAGAIKNAGLFEYIEQHVEGALQLDAGVLAFMVHESVKIKADVVTADEREKGERRKLNFGHTFAHSFEKNLGILHGEAVCIGMVLASKLSEKLGLIGKDSVDRIVGLIEKFGLPTQLQLDKELLLSGMKKDKKREGDNIHLVLLDSIGNAVVKGMAIKEMEALVDDLYSNI